MCCWTVHQFSLVSENASAQPVLTSTTSRHLLSRTPTPIIPCSPPARFASSLPGLQFPSSPTCLQDVLFPYSPDSSHLSLRPLTLLVPCSPKLRSSIFLLYICLQYSELNKISFSVIKPNPFYNLCVQVSSYLCASLGPSHLPYLLSASSYLFNLLINHLKLQSKLV